MLLALLAAPLSARAQPAEPGPGTRHARPHPGETLSVGLLTLARGDHPFFKFGHNAIWIHDLRTGRDRVYNFGTFSFGSLSLIPKFFLGRFEYWLSASNLPATLHHYRSENRSVQVQQLRLTPEQRWLLYQRLEENLKPKNRYYRYDYFRDNCSTRVRDAIDGVLGGRLRQLTAGRPASMTFRGHMLRLTADLLPEYVLLHFATAGLIDRPITEWDEGFIPENLQESVRRLTVPGPDGKPRPLVALERTLVTDDRAPPFAAKPHWAGRFMLAGGALGGALLLAGRARRGRRAARVLVGLVVALLGLVFGFLGTCFVLLWTLTDHEVGYANENILQCAPWALALAVYGIGVALDRPAALRKAYWLTLGAAAAAALGLVLKVLPWFYQDNWQVIGLMLPLWAGGALALRALVHK
ncbi:MAG: DUF4105 domain-containing protein [Deltaproteobacteria bacterium]|nr:DUF4105 domain-containing protein [Deltaproteobacteria bacterium]